MASVTGGGRRLVMARDSLDNLFDALRRRGFRLVGPTVRDGAIAYDDISSSADLPAGWTDEQDGGFYRLRRRDDDALFGYNVGSRSHGSGSCFRRRACCGGDGATTSGDRACGRRAG